MLKAVCSLAFSCLVALSATAGQADVIVGANSAAFGNGPITFYNFPTGTVAGSFIPDGAKLGNNNGRGLALTLDRVFYTELSGGFGPTDFIRIAP
ncbi:MAG TPA: hypothetical protein VFO18_05905, partial [Methylomirabilota bacterium]|nr:hypothetical protein [Methylomirabilota bacterium]